MRTTGVLLVGDPSREPIDYDQLRALAGALAAHNHGWLVQPCLFRPSGPGLEAGIQRLAAQSVSRIAAIPMILSPGSVESELSCTLEAHRHDSDRVTCHTGESLGPDPILVTICQRFLDEAESSRPHVDRSKTAVLLVGRGSSDPFCNADVWKTARLLWEATGFATLECAYSGDTTPSISDGVLRCLKLGARRVILLPYVLFAAAIREQLEAVLAEYRAMFPFIQFMAAGMGGLSASPILLDLLTQRSVDTLEGQAHATCDTCRRRKASLLTAL